MGDEADAAGGNDRIEPVRAALLGLCTVALAFAFLSLLIVDHVDAMTF